MYRWILAIALFPLVVEAGYKNESEAGVVVATGNSRSQSLSFKQEVRYDWEVHLASFKGSFLQSKSFGVLNAKRWGGELRYERSLSDPMGIFLGQGVESDRFAGFLQRYNSDLGARYRLSPKEGPWSWIGEGGYRFSRERKTDGDRLSKNQVRVFTQLVRQWTEASETKLWVEWLPNFTNGPDWALNSELSLTAAMASFLSLKLAYLVKYDHQPNPGVAKKTDSLYTTSLVARF